MTNASSHHERDHRDSVCMYVLQALPAGEVPAVDAQIAACPDCRQEVETLRPIVGAFVSWPTDVLRPAASLWDRLATRIAAETGQPALAEPPPLAQPEWEEVGPGISCRLLATDPEKNRVSMLVRLAPGADYPPHTHAGVEEVHMLQGVLIVDDKKLHPGDYLRSEPSTSDRRVWSETGCTCVLLTSTRDVLR
jgi:quercetin dioxygenase-like cupin family protein